MALTQRRLILASSSDYRRQLLSRLRLVFETISPNVDETPLESETPQQLALRLSVAKASIVALQHPSCIVIGADQVAMVNGHLIGKPGDFQGAQAQLRLLSGQWVEFHSALAVTDGQHTEKTDVVTYCQFKQLSNAAIDTYLHAEKPYDSAGSAKAEGLGITLMQRIQSDDPTALIGLPLIALTEMLIRFGIDPLHSPGAVA
jgi:septum formation protein